MYDLCALWYMLEPKWRMRTILQQNGRRRMVDVGSPGAAILVSAEWSTKVENPVLHFG